MLDLLNPYSVRVNIACNHWKRGISICKRTRHEAISPPVRTHDEHEYLVLAVMEWEAIQ